MDNGLNQNPPLLRIGEASAQVLRPRGRPPGARTAVLREGQVLGIHHFAFLRAVIQGLDTRLAWQRYLSFGGERHEPRRVQQLHQRLWSDVLQRAAWRCAGLPASDPLHAALRALQAPSVRAAAAQELPSLSEFIERQGIDPDHFSQAELLQEYAEHFGIDATPVQPAPIADRTPQAQLRALAMLSEVLVQHPRPADPLSVWLAAPTLSRLQALDADNLGQLAALLAQRGPGWWKDVPGLGQRRAAALAQWLQASAAGWERPVNLPDWTPEARALQRLARWGSACHAAVPAPLRCHAAEVRQDAARQAVAPPGPSPWPLHSAAVTSDWQQALHWLDKLDIGPASRRAYAKEAERFVLWCHVERRIALNQVGLPELQAYASFLAQLPAHWVQAEPLPRTAARWRPFRGPLSAVSKRFALALVQRLVAAQSARAGRPTSTHAATETAKAPMAPPAVTAAAIPTAQPRAPELPRRPEAPVDEGQHQRHPGSSPVQRRRHLVAALMAWRPGRATDWLGATLWPSARSGPGLRPPSQGLHSQTMGLRTARGELMALPPALAAAVLAHHADAPSAPRQPLVHGAPQAPEQPLPLIRALRGPLTRWALGPEGVHCLPPGPADGLALSRAGLRRMLARARSGSDRGR